MRPGGYPFVHALDTVRGVAHCIGLPWTASDQGPLMSTRMTLVDDGSKLALDWKGGKRWLAIDTGTWRVTHPSTSSFPWTWIAGATAAALVVRVVAKPCITQLACALSAMRPGRRRPCSRSYARTT